MANVLNAISEGRQWVVEFSSFRISNDHHRRAINDIGLKTALDIMFIWLDAIVPNAYLIDGRCDTITRIDFSTRAEARRFVKLWGGKLANGGPMHGADQHRV